jgi:hypothetical protein
LNDGWVQAAWPGLERVWLVWRDLRGIKTEYRLEEYIISITRLAFGYIDRKALSFFSLDKKQKILKLLLLSSRL